VNLPYIVRPFGNVWDVATAVVLDTVLPAASLFPEEVLEPILKTSPLASNVVSSKQVMAQNSPVMVLLVSVIIRNPNSPKDCRSVRLEVLRTAMIYCMDSTVPMPPDGSNKTWGWAPPRVLSNSELSSRSASPHQIRA